MSVKQPFMPKYGSNQILTAGAAALVATIAADNNQVRILNTGSNVAYVQSYSSLETVAPTASTTDFPIESGQSCVITKSHDHDRLSYISALGTTLKVMTGEGW